MKFKIERRLEKLITYLEGEVCREFPEFGLSDDLSLEGAAVLLAWFGLAELAEDGDGQFAWVATGRLTSLRTLKDIKRATREKQLNRRREAK